MGRLLTQSLSFILDDDSGEVQASLVPMDGLPTLDMEMLKEALIEAGFGEFRFDEAAMADFIEASEIASDVLTKIVAKRGDGEFSITIADDLMTVTLTLIPPHGGKPVGPAVIQALNEQGIVHGIHRDRLNAALVAGQCENLIIASGDQPQPAIPTRFESLLVDKRAETQKDELAVIDYADLGSLMLINPADPLMRRIPAVQGKDGIDIKGQVVPVDAIADTPFSDKLQGAAPHPDDPDLLVATVAGQPILQGDGVSVNPVVQISNVDLSTGNIDFEGTLCITGDIKAGMRVKVGGDVVVNGMVEAAEISAGGNVSVRGGIVGNASTLVGGGDAAPATVTKIRCKGSVQALFMEHVHVEAEGSIMVDRSVRQCELVAGNEITVGKQGSKSGQIIGGRVHAMQRVAAAVLGSSNGIKTHIQVGSNPFLGEEIAAREKMFQTKMSEMDRVMKLLAYFKKDPAKAVGGVGEKVENTRRQLMLDIESLKVDQKQLMEKNVAVDKACVVVGSIVHEGVEIRIGKHLWQARTDCGSGTARLYEDSVVFGRL